MLNVSYKYLRHKGIRRGKEGTKGAYHDVLVFINERKRLIIVASLVTGNLIPWSRQEEKVRDALLLFGTFYENV